MAELLTHLRDHLVAANVVRDPRTSGDKPPLWRQPRHGVPAPGEKPPNSNSATEIGAEAVLGVYLIGGPAPEPYGASLRMDIVDFRYRTKTAPLAHEIERAIRAALVDRRGWTMAGLPIVETLIFRELQPLGSDEQSFDWVQSYSFERYSGLP